MWTRTALLDSARVEDTQTTVEGVDSVQFLVFTTCCHLFQTVSDRLDLQRFSIVPHAHCQATLKVVVDIRLRPPWAV